MGMMMSDYIRSVKDVIVIIGSIRINSVQFLDYLIYPLELI